MRYYIPLNILSIAHRGYSAKYKDNSWSAFKNVKDKGFDMIEIDIQLCKSGEIIIYHDLFLKNQRIINLTLKEIKKLKKSIVTLKEFFKYFDSNEQLVYLDMKGNDKLAHRLFCFIKAYNINLNKIICCSFNKNHIDYLKLKLPELKVGLITANKFAPEDLEPLTQNIQYLIIDWTVLDRDMIDYCHKKEINVFTYTMKNIDAFNYIKNFDVDGIISNYRLFRSKVGFMFTSY
jgi:glycerophosphoryl diester phosphodiesterase